MTTYGYASADFIRQIRNKCAWLTFFWLLAVLTNFGEVGQRLLDRSWWLVALHTVFVIACAGQAIGQVREWRKWDRLQVGQR